MHFLVHLFDSIEGNECHTTFSFSYLLLSLEISHFWWFWIKQASSDSCLKLILVENFFFSSKLFAKDLLSMKLFYRQLILVLEFSNNWISRLNFVWIKFKAHQLWLLCQLLIKIFVMHSIIIGKELLNSCVLILDGFVMLSWVQTQRSINWWKCYVISILWKINVNSIVHGKLIDWVNSIFYYFLNDLHALNIIQDRDATVKASQQDVLFERMRFHDTGIVFDFFTKSASFV